MKYIIKKYEASHAEIWDEFISRTANGTFLHRRLYMDYHAHLFDDFSWMIFEDNKLKAVLPAHRKGEDVFAHNGLTYSDFLFHFKLKLEHKVEIIQQVLAQFSEWGIRRLVVKDIPFVFHRYIDQSNAYIYHQLQAKITRVKPFFVWIKNNEIKVNRNRLKNIKKLEVCHNYIIDTNPAKLSDFWKIVEQNLHERYESRPVHSFEDMQLLMKRFPHRIRLYTLQENNKMLAGALVYYINKAMHFQYIHSVPESADRMAVEWLTYQVFVHNSDMEYISFGTSATADNNLLKGLVYWKQSFGATLVNQYVFDIPVSNYPLLKNLLQ